MPFGITISAGEDLPIYRQIMRRVVDAIAGGRLAPGQRLPSHRELAQELVIAPLTVKKAYDELEREGYVRTLQGSGTFVSEAPSPLGEREKVERLRPAVRRIVDEAIVLGVSLERVAELLEEEEAAVRRSKGT